MVERERSATAREEHGEYDETDPPDVIIVEEDEGARVDTDADMAGRGVEPNDGEFSAEETAVHVVDEAPGANTDDDPGYVDA